MTFYQQQNGRLHALNPLTKLVLALALVVMAFASAAWLAPAALLALVILPLAMWGRMARPLLRYTAAIALPTLVVIILFQTLLNAGATILFTLGPLRATREGLESGLLTGLRFTVMIAAFLLLLLSTHPGELMDDLTQRGVPASAAYLVASTLNLLPAMQARTTTLMNAQRARGLETEGSLMNRARAVMPLVTPLVLSALSGADERAMALESRAFRAGRTRTFLKPVHDSTWQRFARTALVILALGAIALRLISLIRPLA
jgi:energy-coupling factor transport system permease protein